MRVAVLDDYQEVAGSYADWANLAADMAFFSDHLSDHRALIDRSGSYRPEPPQVAKSGWPCSATPVRKAATNSCISILSGTQVARANCQRRNGWAPMRYNVE